MKTVLETLVETQKEVQYKQKEINDMLKEMEKDTTILSEKDVERLLEQISNK